MDDQPVEAHYDALAESWREFVELPTKRRILWPAVHSFSPRWPERVLDASGTVVASTHPFHDFRVVTGREYPNLSDVWERGYDPVVVPDGDDHDTERFEIR